MSNPIIAFDHELSGEHALVGGKGANLGRLTRAGFQVPPGFTVTTDAYEQFLTENSLQETITNYISRIPDGDADGLEALTAELRRIIISAPMPEPIEKTITAVYNELGATTFVAVRSSGTAEDLAGASFAGLHDTILGVRGPDEVMVAIKECWASMWSARATAYRKAKGFVHAEASIAVVVQTLIDSDTAGVLFTANPMTSSTEEYVVNASLGLGESVVSGVITPDQFILRARDLVPRERTLGQKTIRIQRDPVAGQRTETLEVPAAEQAQLCLTDAQLAQLGDLGRRVTDYYDHIPQDIEWAFHNGELYLLQSRPITGCDFSWDELVDGWQTAQDDDNYVWTRSWADEVWTNAITPLAYSWRAQVYTVIHQSSHKLWGDETTAAMPLFRYHKAEAYENSEVERRMALRAHPAVRPGMTRHMPPDWHQDVLKAKFSYWDYLRMHARILALEPTAGVWAWVKVQYRDYIRNPQEIERSRGKTVEELRNLDDRALVAYIEDSVEGERRYFQDMWSGFFLHARDSMSLLGLMVAKWYDGENTMAFTDLITGVPKPTFTMQENLQLWDLAQQIRRTPVLRKTIEGNKGAAFFTALRDTEQGRAFLADYQEFLAEYGHRGQADRDLYFPRRSEDPTIDYNSFKALLSAGDDADPRRTDETVSARRIAAYEEVLANITAKPLGKLKAEAFKVLLAYVQEFLMYRDNERHLTDLLTWAGKKGLLELNRRLVERGVVDSERDYFFLAREELYEVLHGRDNRTWTKAKITGRAANFDQFLAREITQPMYLQAGKPAALEAEQGEGLHGMGTSRGTVTATARIVKSLSDVGRVREGEILVTNATDPGWTPIFMIIKGIVLETGGMLAHGSCLAREYGLPAVQLGNAMKLIPDGATITINGETGAIEVIEEDELVEAPAPPDARRPSPQEPAPTIRRRDGNDD